MTAPDRIAVVGGGLAGALIATYLGQAGFEVEVFERRADPRSGSRDEGRSINLAISTRGLFALRGVGVEERVLAGAVPMRGRMIHSPRGRLSFQPYGIDPAQAINSVSRGGLNRRLIEAAAECPSVRLSFNARCTGVDVDAGRMTLRDTESGDERVVAADVIIGADGAFSAVRAGMQQRDRFSYSQDYLAHGYKELTIPPVGADAFAMEPNALHIWPRGGYMMIALPNRDGSFTCTLFWPFDGPNSFDVLQSEEEVLSFFRQTFPDAVPIMPTLAQDYFANRPSSLATVRCYPWHAGKAMLIGDACHAVVPFYGQGANAAFEDCTVFAECLAEYGPDWERLIPQFGERRKRHVDALADLALANFVEMRDHVASRGFLVKKQAEKWLHRLLPFWFLPLYSMITFSRIPYADARERARRQANQVRGLVGTLLAFAFIVAILVLSGER